MIRPKNIVIIGGGSGIGLATAKKVLMDTSVKNVIIVSRSLEKLNCAKEHLNDNRVHVATIDISNVKSHRQFMTGVNEMINDCVDGVIISSGLDFDGSNWKGFNISEEDYDRIMNVNLRDSIKLCRTRDNRWWHVEISGCLHRWYTRRKAVER